MEGEFPSKGCPGRTRLCLKGLWNHTSESVSEHLLSACCVPLAVCSSFRACGPGWVPVARAMCQADLSHPASGWKRRLALCHGWKVQPVTEKQSQPGCGQVATGRFLLPGTVLAQMVHPVRHSGLRLNHGPSLSPAVPAPGASSFGKHRPILILI